MDFTRNKSSKDRREMSKFSIEERREMFQDTWYIPGINQDGHIAMFPNEIPERLIRMYSFVGDTVLDPFLGSGTSLAMAAKWNRNGVGIELGYGPDDSWMDFTKNKISEYTNSEDEIEFY
ncbi:MAG: DNA methyltransferase [Candidatus Kariarchaeaceae archaeon]